MIWRGSAEISRGHMDKVEIVSLHKSCNKTSGNSDGKADAKAPKSRYHSFLRKKLKYQKNCHSQEGGRRLRKILQD